LNRSNFTVILDVSRGVADGDVVEWLGCLEPKWHAYGRVRRSRIARQRRDL
jgi:hypothetical protein